MRKSIIVSLRGGDFWDIWDVWYGVGVRPQNGPWPVLRAGDSGHYIRKMGEGYVVGIGYVQDIRLRYI